jgi:hypothetical protein
MVFEVNRFTDGEWYVVGDLSGRTRAHFFQRGPEYDWASASCGLYYSIDKLARSDDIDGDKPHKTNPRARCGSCWRSEVAKARRT